MRYLLLLNCFLFLQLSAKATVVKSSVSFYSEKLEISYDPAMIIKEKRKKLICTRDKCLKGFYAKMKEGPYQVLLDDLLRHKAELELNDWLYCRLVRSAVDKIYANDKELNRALAWWFLMNESGYDARLAISELIHAFLYAPSDQKLTNVGSFTEDGKKFYNLTAHMYGVNTRIAVFNKPKYIANPTGKSFSFCLEKMPKLKPNPSNKTFTFNYEGGEREITLTIDKAIQEVLIDYPLMEEMDMLKAGLSTTLDESLRSQLAPLMEGKTQKEQLEVLAAFTRSAFDYKWDWDVYDEERPMYAEQV
ncbi:MAG: hypothetical protein AB8F74_07610, partial [Saprospiraceae bacterium]